MPGFEVATARGSYTIPAYEAARVRDAMRHGVLSRPAETPLSDVARMMANYRVHAIVVTSTELWDGEPNRRLWGVVTDLGVMRAGADAADRTAGGTATRDVVTVRPDDALVDAARALIDRGSSHAVVVDAGGDPVGMLSTLDVAGAIGWGPPPT